MKAREWHTEPWQEAPFDLAQLMASPPGIVMTHHNSAGIETGCVVLRCPACHTFAPFRGTIDQRDPVTVGEVLHCGCSRCAVDFAITEGQAVRITKTASPAMPTPPAGTKRPPTVRCDGTTVAPSE